LILDLMAKSDSKLLALIDQEIERFISSVEYVGAKEG